MATATEIPGYVSVSEAADIIGVCARLVRRWAQNGTLPHVKVGKAARLLPRKAVEEFAKTERKPGPKPTK